MCAECFEATGSFHDDHDVSVSLNPSGGGCCDCGDPEAWHNPIGCSLHPDPREKGKGSKEADAHGSLPDLTRLTEVIGEILDWCLDVISYSGEEGQRGPPASTLPLPGGIEDELGHETSQGTMYACILWNDETHSFDEVVSQITLAARLSDAKALRITEEVDARGRAILIYRRDLRILHSIARKVEEIGLQLSIQKARDLWAEEEAGILLSVLARLVSPDMEDASSALRQALLQRTNCTSSVCDSYTRLEALLLFDVRLWKEIRLVTRCIYVSAILSDPSSRREMALMFAKMYKTIAKTLLGIDRSPELSILTFSIQMLTVPSIAEELAERSGGLLEDLIYLIIRHFRPADYCSLIFPSSPSPFNLGGRALRCENSVFHNKRFSYLTHDLTFLLGGPLARAAVLRGKEGYERDARAIRLTHLPLAFQGMDGQVRMVGQHVEFESEGWAPAFGLTMQLTQIIEAFGEAIGAFGLPYVNAKLAEWVAEGKAMARFEGPIHFHSSRSPALPRLSQVVSFSVMSQMVSIHLPLHWLLSECLKNWKSRTQSWDNKSQAEEHQGSYNVQLHDQHWHGIFDYPLRTWVWLAQVGAGLWVRNGYGVRRQAHLYRSISLREHTQCADLQLIQTFLGYVEHPSVWFLTLVDRFGLLGWWKQAGCRGTEYDERQFRHMLEELLYLIILTIKERPHLAGWDEERRVERALIHATALPAPYTEIMYRLPESIGRSRILEQVMSRVSSTTGEGEGPERWRLNEEDRWMDQVDPYWVHYSRNMRVELLEWKRKRQAKATDTTSRLPHLIPLPTTSPYHGYAERLYDGEAGEMMLLLVGKVWSLSREGDEEDEGGEVGGGSGGGVREMSLHLILLGLSMCKDTFSRALYDTLLPLSGERVSLYTLLKEWIIQRQQQQEEGKRVAQDQENAELEGQEGEEESKEKRRRREAKERQERMVADFVKAQQAFMLNNAEWLEEDQEEEDEEIAEGDDSSRKIPIPPWTYPKGTCMVCQDELGEASPQASRTDETNSSSGERDYGMLAFLQTSMRQRIAQLDDRKYVGQLINQVIKGKSDEEKASPFLDDSFPEDPKQFRNQSAMTWTSCGHLIHADCLQGYYNSIRARHMGQPTRRQPESLERGEFLCPLCKALGNALIPM
ncbi:MAG: hypothetical protein DHS80DRAFT_16059, partial [Piptocephalis tieghemiana]